MYQARIEAAPVREGELTALTRDYETLQQTYRNLLQKKEESQISANLEKRQIGEQFRILDPARSPEKPVSPDRPRLYVIALFAALAIGLGLAAVAEYFDRSLRTEADVRAALNLLVLATVPYMRDTAASARRLRRRLAIGAGHHDGDRGGSHRRMEALEIVMYERYYGLVRAALRSVAESAVSVLYATAPRSARALAVRAGRAAGHNDAGRRGGHRQDHADARRAAGRATPRRRSSICRTRR